MSRLRKGARVTWRWGLGQARGEVREIHPGRLSQTIRGEVVTRNGSPENPAVVVELADGSRVLKLASELRHDD